jgi:hypothetical protein
MKTFKPLADAIMYEVLYCGMVDAGFVPYLTTRRELGGFLAKRTYRQHLMMFRDLALLLDPEFV